MHIFTTLYDLLNFYRQNILHNTGMFLIFIFVLTVNLKFNVHSSPSVWLCSKNWTVNCNQTYKLNQY